MKNTVQVHREPTASQPSLQPQTGALQASVSIPILINSIAPVMEPELAEIAGGWNARKCIYLADKFERWVNQLRASAEFQRVQRLQSN